MDTISMIALVIALIVGIALIVMVRKGFVQGETLTGVADLFQALPVTMGSGLFGKILEYSQTAVLTVEQLVKTGQIKKEDQARKDAAMHMVECAAHVDEVPFGAAESEVASLCIEAAVQQLPRNQQKINDAADA